MPSRGDRHLPHDLTIAVCPNPSPETLTIAVCPDPFPFACHHHCCRSTDTLTHTREHTQPQAQNSSTNAKTHAHTHAHTRTRGHRHTNTHTPRPSHESESLDSESDSARFAFFSLKFSPGGREILGGASDNCCYVFDVERKQRVVCLPAHDDDVNSVAYAGDGDGGSVFLTGSDDGYCKVWDRRLLGVEGGQATPVGVFAGHREGITHVDAKVL